MDEVVYEKLLLLIVAVPPSNKVEICILDRYIYIYTYIKNENKKNVYKKQTREKQTYSDYLWRGV